MNEVPALLDGLFSTEAQGAVFCDGARVQAMLDFEAALARGEARCGVIPEAAAQAIVACCRAELFDLRALGRATALAGNPAIALVEALGARVAQADAQAAGYVHWGATSQDAMDSGLVLQLRAALAAIDADLDALAASLATLAATHRRTPMAGRTLLQQAAPLSFGLKLAGWLGALDRHRQRLAELRPRLLVLQFGGAVGTLAALGTRGLDVAAALAEELRLGLPEAPWHAQRDRLGEAAAALGLLAAGLGKMGRDLALLAQTEVAEVFEAAAAGRGGSSALPQKRNPVAASVAIACGLRVPALVAIVLAAGAQEHERGVGDWHAEWETLPEIFRLTGGALARLREAFTGLEVDAQRMRANLDLGGGQIVAEAVSMALARDMGRRAAHALVGEACRRASGERRTLHDVLAADARVGARLDAAALARLCDPEQYLGLAAQLVDRVLASHAGRKP